MSEQNQQPAMRAAKAPVGTGSAPLVAQLIGLALVVIGVVAVHDALARTGVVHQRSWILTVLRAVDGRAYDNVAVLLVGVALVVVGLLLLPVVVLRRPRTSVDLDATTGVHLRTRDLSRIVADSVDGADAVTDVRVRATRTRVRVRVTTLAMRDRREEIRTSASERVEPVLAALARPPRASITIQHEES